MSPSGLQSIWSEGGLGKCPREDPSWLSSHLLLNKYGQNTVCHMHYFLSPVSEKSILSWQGTASTEGDWLWDQKFRQTEQCGKQSVMSDRLSLSQGKYQMTTTERRDLLQLTVIAHGQLAAKQTAWQEFMAEKRLFMSPWSGSRKRGFAGGMLLTQW